MTTLANSYFYRRRTIGRAASPPTWACYEQIPFDDDDYSDSGSDSCSEDEEDYVRAAAMHEPSSDSEHNDHVVAMGGIVDDDAHDLDMDIDVAAADAGAAKRSVDNQKDVKGKQRAIEPEPETKKRHPRRKREQVYTLRPILTIQRSQGFVWNQVSTC